MILAEMFLIVLYLVDSKLAFVFSLLFFGTIMFRHRLNLLQGLLKAMIYSSPLFSISLIGNQLHQIFSWTMIFLILYTIFLFFDLISHGGKSFRILNICLLIVFLFLIIRNIFGNFVLGNLEELFQLTIMIVPIYFTFLDRHNLKRKLQKVNIEEWKKDIQNTVFATAMAVIFQYISYQYFGNIYGNVSLLNNRIIFDLFFKGYSVLSLFLSVGVALYCDEFFDHYHLSSGIKMLIILISIAINSSRAGLMGAFIVCAIIFLKHVNNRKTILLNLLILVVGIVGMYFLINQLTISRGDSSFLVSSGRESTYLYAFDMITTHTTIFLFGGGLSPSNYTQVLPHNFVLQLFLTMGVFVTIILCGFIISLLNYVRRTPYLYVLLAIVIGGLFITDFHSNVFFTIFSICGILTSYCFREREG